MPKTQSSTFIVHTVLRMASVKAATTIGEKAKEAAVATSAAISSAAAATGQSINNATQAVRQHDWTREEEALNKVKQQAIGYACSRYHACDLPPPPTTVLPTLSPRAAPPSSKTCKHAHLRASRKFLVGPWLTSPRASPMHAPAHASRCAAARASSPGGSRSQEYSAALPTQTNSTVCMARLKTVCVIGRDYLQLMIPTPPNPLAANGLVLPPPGTSPHVLAHVMKKFLITLPEPLLTFKYDVCARHANIAIRHLTCECISKTTIQAAS